MPVKLLTMSHYFQKYINKMLSRCIRSLKFSGIRTPVRFSTTSTGTGSAEIWDWVPPSSQKQTAPSADNFVIPVLPGVELTSDEVRQYLESQGAENAIVLDVNGDFDEFKQMVIASGRSTRHIRKMTQSIIAAMKERRLKNTGIEGESDDDWQLVNCKSFLVHVMLPKTRKHIDLESHWSKPYRPTITYHRNENLYEEQFMKLLEKYPCPDDYVQNADISAGGPVVKEF